jgi:hypothetical protein
MITSFILRFNHHGPACPAPWPLAPALFPDVLRAPCPAPAHPAPLLLLLLPQPEEVEICKRPDGTYWQLGTGAFGTCYKGLYHGTQLVAVKVRRRLRLQLRLQLRCAIAHTCWAAAGQPRDLLGSLAWPVLHACARVCISQRTQPNRAPPPLFSSLTISAPVAALACSCPAPALPLLCASSAGAAPAGGAAAGGGV